MNEGINTRRILRTNMIEAIGDSDLVAVRIEKDKTYYICKNFYELNDISYESGDIIDEKTFRDILQLSKNPIVLSDRYVDL